MQGRTGRWLCACIEWRRPPDVMRRWLPGGRLDMHMPHTHLPMMLPAWEWHTSIRVRMPCGCPGAAGIGSSPSITLRCTSNSPSCGRATSTMSQQAALLLE